MSLGRSILRSLRTGMRYPNPRIPIGSLRSSVCGLHPFYECRT